MDNGDVDILLIIATSFGGIATLMGVALGIAHSLAKGTIRTLAEKVDTVIRDQKTCPAKIKEDATAHLHEMLTPVVERLHGVHTALDELNNAMAGRTAAGLESQRNIEMRLKQLETELKELQNSYTELRVKTARVEASRQE